MAVILHKLNKKAAEALARKIEKLKNEAIENSANMGSGQYPYYYGFVDKGLEFLINEIKTGSFTEYAKK